MILPPSTAPPSDAPPCNEYPASPLWHSACSSTVSFHNFKSQNLKLSVSNPKSKYVAYLSVLSRISNCQGLGRKKKLEILKTDRIGARQRGPTPSNRL